eukprot:4780875-Lingulodinium_polyedra.AAC.1
MSEPSDDYQFTLPPPPEPQRRPQASRAKPRDQPRQERPPEVPTQTRGPAPKARPPTPQQGEAAEGTLAT